MRKDITMQNNYGTYIKRVNYDSRNENARIY